MAHCRVLLLCRLLLGHLYRVPAARQARRVFAVVLHPVGRLACGCDLRVCHAPRLGIDCSPGRRDEPEVQRCPSHRPVLGRGRSVHWGGCIRLVKHRSDCHCGCGLRSLRVPGACSYSGSGSVPAEKRGVQDQGRCGYPHSGRRGFVDGDVGCGCLWNGVLGEVAGNACCGQAVSRGG